MNICETAVANGESHPQRNDRAVIDSLEEAGDLPWPSALDIAARPIAG